MIKTITRAHKYYRIAAQLVFVFILFNIVIVLTTPEAHASSNPTDTYIVEANDFYAYVQTGQNLDVSFEKAFTGGSDADAVITVSRPAAADATCTVLAAAPVGTTCNFTNQTATATGIWHISFSHSTGSLDYFNWATVVQTGSTTIPGRVWSPVYNIVQFGGTPPTGVDFGVWYQSEFGYLYSAQYADYNGISSAIKASSLGLVHSGGGCIPLYKSVNRNSATYAVAPASCDSDFKLFFETPASDLPASATQWDGATDWVKPSVMVPAISELSFSPTTTNSRDGNVTFDLTNFTGVVNIYIDTNNNGSYSDPEDVLVPFSATDGANTVPFDGNDGNGDPIPQSQTLNFKASIERTAEIHFLANDVELRGGGIEVQRLNGPAGNENVIYWDDTDLADPDVNRCSFTAQRDGTAGVDSTGGIHSWSLSGCGAPQYGNFNNNINGSWGDSRYINEWAFVPTNTFETYTLAGYNPVVTPVAVLADTGQDQSLVFGLATFLILIPFAMLVTWRGQISRK